VKPDYSPVTSGARATFSILERIDVGETKEQVRDGQVAVAFSILERIDVGETAPGPAWLRTTPRPFSILERIDVGETSSFGFEN